jgi:hypothetical protein
MSTTRTAFNIPAGILPTQPVLDRNSVVKARRGGRGAITGIRFGTDPRGPRYTVTVRDSRTIFAYADSLTVLDAPARAYRDADHDTCIGTRCPCAQ